MMNECLFDRSTKQTNDYQMIKQIIDYQMNKQTELQTNKRSNKRSNNPTPYRFFGPVGGLRVARQSDIFLV